jgi:hypothetical protein
MGVERMSKNKPGIPASVKGLKKEEQITLTGIIIDIINYVEVATGALNYLANQKRLTPQMQFRLEIESKFARNMVLSYFKVTPSYLQDIVEEIHEDKDVFQKAVIEFADAVVPEKSLLVTKNLEGEMKNIIGQQKMLSKKDIIIGGKE